MNDEGVSELMGYSIMAGMVITAVICVTSGAAGVISSSVEQMSLSEAVLSMQSLSATAMESSSTGNTCPVASEIQVPAGYELFVIGGPDDIARLSVELDGKQVYDARTGSIRLQSPFRSVSFEGGAVFGNDSGSVSIVREPSVFVASHNGRTAVYVFLTCITADYGIIATDSHAVLDFRVASHISKSASTPAPATIAVMVSSRDPEGWADYLRSQGFTVTLNGNAVTATTGGVSDVHVSCTTLQVGQG